MGTKSSLEKRSNSFKPIPENDIKGKMLRFKFYKIFCRERLLKLKLGSLGKRWERSNTLGTFGTSPRSRRVRRSLTFLTFHFIYIYRYLVNKQLLFLTINTFIHRIFNVMFNPVHHHCHPFTDYYKRFTCAEPKTFLIARKSNIFILWKTCLLVVPAGHDPRTYSIGTLQLHVVHVKFS